jgi:hypothetical protein
VLSWIKTQDERPFLLDEAVGRLRRQQEQQQEEQEKQEKQGTQGKQLGKSSSS